VLPSRGLPDPSLDSVDLPRQGSDPDAVCGA